MVGCVTLCCAGLKPNPIFKTSAPDANARYVDVALPSANSRSFSEFEERLLAEINLYLGAPYRRGGMNRAGMDCSGLVNTVYRNVLGLELPRKVTALYKYGNQLDREHLRLGDLVFFERMENYGVSHVGIYLGEDEFAHASSGSGVIISNLNEPYYRTRFVGAKRVTKLE